jgi:hypothetical protein
MSKRVIILLALFTLLFFGIGGAIILTYTRDVTLPVFLKGRISVLYQIAIGLAFGFVTAMAGWGIVELPLLAKTRNFFVDLIKPLSLSWMEIVFISICAGIGEELFFRGAIQPWLGIWTTAVLFVLLHGYLNPFNLPMSLYGVYMTLVIGVMGLMTEHFGILTAIFAHKDS